MAMKNGSFYPPYVYDTKGNLYKYYSGEDDEEEETPTPVKTKASKVGNVQWGCF